MSPLPGKDRSYSARQKVSGPASSGRKMESFAGACWHAFRHYLDREPGSQQTLPGNVGILFVPTKRNPMAWRVREARAFPPENLLEGFAAACCWPSLRSPVPQREPGQPVVLPVLTFVVPPGWARPCGFHLRLLVRNHARGSAQTCGPRSALVGRSPEGFLAKHPREKASARTGLLSQEPAATPLSQEPAASLQAGATANFSTPESQSPGDSLALSITTRHFQIE